MRENEKQEISLLWLYLISPCFLSSTMAVHVSIVLPPMAECIRYRSTYCSPNLNPQINISSDNIHYDSLL